MIQHYKQTDIVIQDKSLYQLQDIVDKYAIQKALILISKTIQRSLYYQTALSSLDITYIEYNQIEKDPDDDMIMNALYTARKYQCDGVIAIGGGSVLDTGKAVSLMYDQKQHILNFIHDKSYDIEKTIPLICIPTTIGTGSEISKNIVVKNHRTGRKHRIIEKAARADFMMIDCEFMKSLTVDMVLYGSMDILAHAIEAYTNKKSMTMPDEFIDECALTSIQLVTKHLKPALFGELHDRMQLQLASLYAGIAMENDLHANHILAGCIHEMFPQLHHGMCVGMLLPYIMQYNASTCKSRYDQINDRIQMDCINWIIQIQQQFHYLQLSDYIHTLEDADRLIEMMIQKNISINPISISPQQIKQMIYQACYIKRQE